MRYDSCFVRHRGKIKVKMSDENVNQYDSWLTTELFNGYRPTWLSHEISENGTL